MDSGRCCINALPGPVIRVINMLIGHMTLLLVEFQCSPEDISCMFACIAISLINYPAASSGE